MWRGSSTSPKHPSENSCCRGGDRGRRSRVRLSLPEKQLNETAVEQVAVRVPVHRAKQDETVESHVRQIDDCPSAAIESVLEEQLLARAFQRVEPQRLHLCQRRRRRRNSQLF